MKSASPAEGKFRSWSDVRKEDELAEEEDEVEDEDAEGEYFEGGYEEWAEEEEADPDELVEPSDEEGSKPKVRSATSMSKE